MSDVEPREGRMGVRKPQEMETWILQAAAMGTPITEIKKEIDKKYPGENISRQTIYNILGRYGVRQTKADQRFKVLLKDSKALSRMMLRLINDRVDKDEALAHLSEFDARWG